MNNPRLLERIVELQQQSQAFVLATVTWVRGPTSGNVGGKAIIHPTGETEGWIGGACSSPTLIEAALSALGDGTSRLLILGEDDPRPGVETVSMACASEGAMEVFLEPMPPVTDLKVIGRSPMTQLLTDLANRLGWRTTIIEEPEQTEANNNTLVVIATQGHFDETAIEAVLSTSADYIGLVASATRAEAIREWLRLRGVPEDDIARIKAPAGIDLGKTTHEEMAVSILAELVQHKNSRKTLTEPEIPALDTQTDPICGMTVNTDRAVWVNETDKLKTFFCSAQCQQTWETTHTTSS